MIQRYSIRYQIADGLVAHLPPASTNLENRDRIYLGWNIELDEDDRDGRRFIQRLFTEMGCYPHQWRITELDNGVREMRRLVRVRLVTSEDEYSSSQSEHWLDA